MLNIRRSLRIAITLGLMLVLSGCSHVSTRVYKVPVPAERENAVEIIDQRPESEKSFRLRSSLTTNCEFAISDFGDKNLSPPPMQILKATLGSALSRVDQTRRIEVQSFRVINNLQGMTRKSVEPTPEKTQAAQEKEWNQGRSGLGAAAVDIGVRGAITALSCNADKSIIGAADPETNPNNVPQILVLIDVVSGAQRYSVSHVELYSGGTEQTTARAVLAATHKLAELMNGNRAEH